MRALSLLILLACGAPPAAAPTPVTPDPAVVQTGTAATPEALAEHGVPPEPAAEDGATPDDGEPAAEPTAEPTAEPEPEPAPTVAAKAADGAPCLTATDCASNICEGEGCDDAHPGTCAPAMRACTRDLRPYCGCDGEVFQTSGTCPNRRYAAKGLCAK